MNAKRPARTTIRSLDTVGEEGQRGSLARLSSRPRNHALLFGLTGPQQGAVFPLHGTSLRLGRGPDVEIELDDDAVSGHHAHVTRRHDGIYLTDDGSRNGTFVNDRCIRGAELLCDGDHIRMGNSLLRFSLVDALEERALTNLYEVGVRDPLTRAYNRRYLVPHLHNELAFSARQATPLALLLVDIDHFKRVNDTYGHALGDAVLKLVAGSIQRSLRPYDILCRYGGEEFIVVARDTSLRNAEILAHRIRRCIEATRFDVANGSASVTVSIGVTAVAPAPGAEDADALIMAADDALYAAKAAGRNRVSTCAPPASPPSPRAARARHTSPPLYAADHDETIPDLALPTVP